MAKGNINNREDIATLIGKFYEKVRSDVLLGPIFSHVDWEHHTPLIIDFWAMVLLGDPAYKGNPFVKHLALPIGRLHFERWLQLFSETVHENFEGDKANEAIERANSIASVFQFKLGLLDR